MLSQADLAGTMLGGVLCSLDRFLRDATELICARGKHPDLDNLTKCRSIQRFSESVHRSMEEKTSRPAFFSQYSVQIAILCVLRPG